MKNKINYSSPLLRLINCLVVVIIVVVFASCSAKKEQHSVTNGGPVKVADPKLRVGTISELFLNTDHVQFKDECDTGTFFGYFTDIYFADTVSRYLHKGFNVMVYYTVDIDSFPHFIKFISKYPKEKQSDIKETKQKEVLISNPTTTQNQVLAQPDQQKSSSSGSTVRDSTSAPTFIIRGEAKNEFSVEESNGVLSNLTLGDQTVTLKGPKNTVSKTKK